MRLCVDHLPEMSILVFEMNATCVRKSYAFDADKVHLYLEAIDMRLSLARHNIAANNSQSQHTRGKYRRGEN